MKRRLLRAVVLPCVLALVAGWSPTGAADEFSWNTAAGGSWGNSTLWTKDAGAGAQTIPSVAGDVANVRQNIAAATTITLDGDRTIGVLNIGDTASAWSYFVIAPGDPAGSLIFDNVANSAQLNVYGNYTTIATAQITTPVVLTSSLIMARPEGNGTFNINGRITGDGGLSVTSGSFYLSNTNLVSGLSNAFTGNISVSGGATLRAFTTVSLGHVSTGRAIFFNNGTVNIEGYTSTPATSNFILDVSEGPGTLRIQGATGAPIIGLNLNGNGDFTKTGAATGRLQSAATNRTDANTYITGGALAIRNAALGTNPNIYISGGTGVLLSLSYGQSTLTLNFNILAVGTTDAGGRFDLNHETTGSPTRIVNVNDLRMRNGRILLGRNNNTEGSHTLRLLGNVTIEAIATGTGSYVEDNGTAASGRVNLGVDGWRTFNVADGAIANDFRISVPILNDTGVESGLIKEGAGLMVLNLRAGESTYSGGTQVANGILSVQNAAGSATGTGGVAVLANGTLAGNGTISGTVTVDGKLAPGTSVGALTVGGLTLNSGATSEFEIQGLGAGQFDTLVSTGTAEFGGTLSLKFDKKYNEGDAWKLFDFTTSNGTFAALTDTSSPTPFHTADELTFDPSTGTLSIIPEPGTIGLGLGGLTLLLLGGARRKR